MSARLTPALVAMMILTTLPAAAKGPQSATLAGPGIDEPIVFLKQRGSFGTLENQAPVELMGITGIYGMGRPGIERPSALGPQYTVTWTNMGTNDVIVQHLYPEAVGGPVIHTPAQEGLEGWGQDVTGWFEAPVQLRETIHDLLVWATTPAGVAMKPNPPLPTTGSASIWVIVAIAFPLAAVAIFRAGYLRRTRIDELA